MAVEGAEGLGHQVASKGGLHSQRLWGRLTGLSVLRQG